MKLSIFSVILFGAVLATINANPNPHSLQEQDEERAADPNPLTPEMWENLQGAGHDVISTEDCFTVEDCFNIFYGLPPRDQVPRPGGL